jgi:hypothetical protein
MARETLLCVACGETVDTAIGICPNGHSEAPRRDNQKRHGKLHRRLPAKPAGKTDVFAADITIGSGDTAVVISTRTVDGFYLTHATGLDMAPYRCTSRASAVLARDYMRLEALRARESHPVARKRLQDLVSTLKRKLFRTL